jgi:hypothetical protein
LLTENISDTGVTFAVIAALARARREDVPAIMSTWLPRAHSSSLSRVPEPIVTSV